MIGVHEKEINLMQLINFRSMVMRRTDAILLTKKNYNRMLKKLDTQYAVTGMLPLSCRVMVVMGGVWCQLCVAPAVSVQTLALIYKLVTIR